ISHGVSASARAIITEPVRAAACATRNTSAVRTDIMGPAPTSSHTMYVASSLWMWQLAMTPAPTVPTVASRRVLRSFREVGASSRERNVPSSLTQPDGRAVPSSLLAILTMASLINYTLRWLQERSLQVRSRVGELRFDKAPGQATALQLTSRRTFTAIRLERWREIQSPEEPLSWHFEGNDRPA